MPDAKYIGTFKYGLNHCWSTCKHLGVIGANFKKKPQASVLEKLTKNLAIPKYKVDIRSIRNSGPCHSYAQCYCLTVTDPVTKLNKVIALRSQFVHRLYSRYCSQLSSRKRAVTDPSNCDHALPGIEDKVFLTDLCSLAVRKFEGRFDNMSRTAPPDLYTVWAITSHISTELFADALNESGVLQNYCSLDEEDSKFGANGPWSSVEEHVEGAGGNPPFDTEFIKRMMQEFDRGARSQKPYCSCALLPLGKRHRVIEQTESLTGKGILLVRIPSGCISFRYQEEYFMARSTPQVSGFQDLGLFIWRNRDYLQKYPPPQDVELVYWEWIARSCHRPDKVYVDIEGFRMAFPLCMRSAKQGLPLFSPDAYDPLSV